MNDEPAGFFKRKTTWTALLSIIGAAAGVATGTLPAAAGAQLIVTALLGLTLRSAIAKQ